MERCLLCFSVSVLGAVRMHKNKNVSKFKLPRQSMKTQHYSESNIK